MQPHNPSHAALLERILVGELPPTAAEARELLEQCATCRERLRELELLQSRLGAAGEEERAGVAQAAAGVPTAQSERRIQEFVGARTRHSSARTQRIRWVLIALAASLCVVIAYRLLRPQAPAHRDDILLHGGEEGVLKCIKPEGHKQTFGEFTWTSPPLQPGETFRLRITNLDRPDSDPLVIANIEATVWRRASAGVVESRRVEEFFAGNPGNIEWLVEICDVGKQAVDKSKPVEASLY